jgi:hypothetical protein
VLFECANQLRALRSDGAVFPKEPEAQTNCHNESAEMAERMMRASGEIPTEPGKVGPPPKGYRGAVVMPKCQSCNGAGKHRGYDSPDRCSDCNGTGRAAVGSIRGPSVSAGNLFDPTGPRGELKLDKKLYEVDSSGAILIPVESKPVSESYIQTFENLGASPKLIKLLREYNEKFGQSRKDAWWIRLGNWIFE